MDADWAKRLIDAMAETSSRTEKEKLLAELAGEEIGRWILKWTYDPFITFGLTPTRRKEAGKIALGFRSNLVESLLKRLAARQLTGSMAQQEVREVMEAFNATGAELLFLILSKDLKCGIAEATITAVVPGLIPVFSVMRAHKFEEKRVKKWPVFVEPKLDGFRVSFLCREGHGGFFTRSGKRMPALDHLVQDVIDAAITVLGNSNSDLRFALNPMAGSLGRYARDDLNFMLDGEAMTGSFNETSGALRRESEKAENVTFHIFDLMSYADFDAIGSVGKTYVERRKLVEEFVILAGNPALTATPRYFVHSTAEIFDFYEKFRARGLEGAMVKLPDGLYDKKKTYGWMKIKAEETEDLPVIGAFSGEPNTKYEHCLGGLIVDRNGVEVRVGGGFTDAEREELWKLFCSDAGHPMIGEDYAFWHPKLLGRLIEVLFHEVTPDGSLRHPRFKRFRDDKTGEVQEKEAA